MSFINAPSIVSYTAIAGQTVFEFGFKWYQAEDITVFQIPKGEPGGDAYIVDPGQYTITAVGANIGGSITLNTGAALDDNIVIQRILPVVRTVEYAFRGSIKSGTLNDDQDYQTYLLQDFVALSNLMFKVPPGSDIDTTFPAPVPDAYIKYNAEGTALETDDTIPESVIEATEQAYHAQASTLTAESYATEPEDEEVKIYTSNGDGTYTATPQAGVFSALHYELKSGINSNFSQQNNWAADAEKQTADSYANKFFDTSSDPQNYVDQYSSNGDGTFTATPLIGIYSSKWHSEKSKEASGPLTYIGLWDASGGDGTLPIAGTTSGEYYIVSVQGTVDGIYYKVGELIIWNGTLWQHIEKEEGGGIEAGIVMSYASSAVPSGWLVCDGSEVSKTTFPDLFTAIGTTWDLFGGVAAPAAGNFRLPPQELNGKPLYLVGSGSNLPGTHIQENVGAHTHALSADSTFTGAAAGTHTHVFTGAALPNHSHTQPYNPIGGGGNIHHILGGSSGGYATSGVSAGTPAGTNSETTNPTPAGTVATTINETPITGNNNPESAVMVMCIKAFGVVYNPDSVDIQALEQQVLANEQAIADLVLDIFPSEDEYVGSIDDFIVPNVYGVTFAFGQDNPSVSPSGTLTVSNSFNGSSNLVVQNWQTRDATFTRHKQGATWGAWLQGANKPYVDSRIQQVTQAEYDALTPDPTVLYAIVG